MADRTFTGRVRGNEAPLILQILHHRDDIAIAKKALAMEADDQALFPILVALARLAAKADIASSDPAQGPEEPT